MRSLIFFLSATCVSAAIFFACSSSSNDSNDATLSDAGSSGDATFLDDSAPSEAGDGGDAAALVGTSLKKFAVCDGVTDDALAVAAAFAAAKNGAFHLIVDCPAFVHVGRNIARPIFIDDGTTVIFAGAGKFIIDNELQPEFVIADSSNITLTNWNLEYQGGIPVDILGTGYQIADGGEVAPNSSAPVGGAFNDLTLTRWLEKNRGITFSGASSAWEGPTNVTSIFFIVGNSSNITIDGLNAYVPASAGGDKFIPSVFSTTLDALPNTTITSTTPQDAAHYAIPHGLTFSNITLDGTLMGWVGSCYDTSIAHVVSNRYADLMDADGNNVGGIGKWFAPPHLIYWRFTVTDDPVLWNRNISISDVTDNGIRVGTARDDSTDGGSGYALSLKLGANDAGVDNYKSARPDGFMDTLNSDGLIVTNATATYDSTFLHGIYPGWRWPAPPYTNVTFQNISLTDTTTSPSLQPPMANSTTTESTAVTMSNVHLALHDYAGNGSVLPIFNGTSNDLNIDVSLLDSQGTAIERIKNSMTETLQAVPSTLHVGSSFELTWSSKTTLTTSTCTASGGWTNAIGASGTQSITATAAGTVNYVLTCNDGTSTAVATMPVDVLP